MTSSTRTAIASLALVAACSTPPSPRAPAVPEVVPERTDDEQCEVLFVRIDANGDGSVSEAEFSTLPHAEQEDSHTTFVLRDQSQDGGLSSAEFCAPARVALIL